MKLKGIQRKFLRARLLDNEMTLAEFAKENGFKYQTVQKVLSRVMNNPDYKPRGTITTEILMRLGSYIGEQNQNEEASPPVTLSNERTASGSRI